MPLMHILAPQILRRAQAIEEALGPAVPPTPMASGYLQAGYEKTPYDPRGVLDKPSAGKTFDPRYGAGKEMALMGGLQRSENPYTRGFANSYLQARGNPYPTAEPMPNAPAAPMRLVKKGDKVGTKGRVIQLDPKAAVGTDERGESVAAPQADKRGKVTSKKLGYLAQPSIETPSGSTPMRNPDRRGKDIGAWDTDALSNAEIEKRYGKHLKAMQENRDSQGMPTDKFPDGYFDGASAKEKKAVVDGVKELRKRQKLAEEGTPI